MIINGKKIAQKIYTELKNEVAVLGEKPCLAIILVGENSPSLRYIEQKRKWAEYIGYTFHLFEYPESVDESTILSCIETLNGNPQIHGVMIQTPLPSQIHTQKIIDTIHPDKDIDGFHAINQGKIVLGDTSGLPACTPAGIMEIFFDEKIELIGKYIVIIGRSNIVGKPLANMCINAGATVTICNSHTPHIELFTRQADIVVMAAGKPNLLKKEMISDHTIIIDVGFSIIEDKIYGDADFTNINKTHRITPSPGGVGPMTVASLMKNVLKAYKIQLGKI